MKHHLKLLKIIVTIVVKGSGVLPLFSHGQMAHISDGTAPCHLQAVPTSICTARIAIHIENQPTYSK